MTPITHQPVQHIVVHDVTDAPGSVRAHLPNITLALLRVVAGLMFLQHGMQKLFGWFAEPNSPFAAGPPPTLSQMWIAGVLEVGGGVLLALGLFTRPVAFLIAGEMAVAYFQAHYPRGFWPIMNGGEVAVLYCFVFLVYVAIGGGRYSLDHLLHAGREPKRVRGVSETRASGPSGGRERAPSRRVPS